MKLIFTAPKFLNYGCFRFVATLVRFSRAIRFWISSRVVATTRPIAASNLANSDCAVDGSGVLIRFSKATLLYHTRDTICLPAKLADPQLHPGRMATVPLTCPPHHPTRAGRQVTEWLINPASGFLDATDVHGSWRPRALHAPVFSASTAPLGTVSPRAPTVDYRSILTWCAHLRLPCRCNSLRYKCLTTNSSSFAPQTSRAHIRRCAGSNTHRK
jgi:hypothetical protein